MADPAETAQNLPEAPQTGQTPLPGPVTPPEAIQPPQEVQTPLPGPVTPSETAQPSQGSPNAAGIAQEPPPEDLEKATAPAKAPEPPPEPPYPAEVICKCGRKVPTDQKAKKPMGHRIGKEHPGFPGMSTAKRKQTWCPEGAERPPLPEKPPKKMSRRERRRA